MKCFSLDCRRGGIDNFSFYPSAAIKICHSSPVHTQPGCPCRTHFHGVHPVISIPMSVSSMPCWLPSFTHKHSLTHLQLSVPWQPAHTKGDCWVMTMDYFIILCLTGWQGAYMVLTRARGKRGNTPSVLVPAAVMDVSLSQTGST